MKTLEEIKSELESAEKEYRLLKDEYQNASKEFKEKIKAIKIQVAVVKGLHGSLMGEREMFILKNIKKGPTELGKILGVSAARAGQIRAKAIRKLSHPSRKALAEELGISLQDI
jgi:DNA-directed RNA polymerase sigma subunit (sigma70/sigma32)